MNAIPTKVVAVLGAEAGFAVGFIVIMFYTLRTVRTITVNDRWNDFNKLSKGRS